VNGSVRRRGVASRLVSLAEAWARSNSSAYVALASRSAPGFYVRNGYEESAKYFRKILVELEDRAC